MVNQSSQSRRSGRDAVTRRTVAKGAAWSVPVVALAAGAPAASASPATCDVTLSVPGGAKVPPEMTVGMDVTVVNNSGTEQTVTILSITGPNSGVWGPTDPSTFPASPGTSTVTLNVSRSNNANGDATITYEVCGQTKTATFYVSI
ncbi:hypothetical protein HJ588_08560 [Flexivirga sp. ID2601S]|uniref:Uncharacterized protein n=1 Tax=Flexivirga aerilata TaxID=1656889 RepID=A0A849AFR7_9MICO|nr:hypothetical protein [Flexivirga aerilata]NNG39325.1 hypothetical protein [Flexivirga aerilata]